MNQHTLKYQLLADLLATLEAEEFPIGVGKHLELQQLYSMLPEDIKPEEMKTLLAPIFAKNKQDQEFFYDVFDQSLKHIEAKTWEPKDQPITPILPPKSKWEIITRLLGLTLFLVAVTLTYLRISGNQPLVMPPICEQELVVEPDSIYTLNLLDSIALENELREKLIKGASLEFVSFLNGETVGEIPEIGTYQIDSNGIFSIKTIEDFDERNESFVVTAIAKYELGTDTTNFIIKQKEEIIEEDEVKLPPAKKYSSLSLEPHPFPKVLPFPKQPPQWVSNFQKYKYWIKPILIFLLFAMFGAYLNWWAERQQKIIADIQSKNDPPLLWNIQIPNISKIELNEDYFKVLQLMRQRTSDDHYVLNIPKTIDKTIEKGGIIDFQYQHKTRPPEYLLLIDRQSSKNHRAYLYNYMFESFKANEVYIERFFYEGDIRLCWNEYYPNGIKLHDLQQTFRDARLIIVGSGYQLLNPVSGKMAKWTRIFDNWSDKAILSPRPTKNWAGREMQLKQKFILLPASVQSLTTMVDKMEAIDPEEIKTKINDEVNEPIEFRGSLIETLQHYFAIKKSGEPRDESLIHWIAACAIYPTLHWDLTMYLGQELSTVDNNLLTFDNINQLTRLPWFVEGKIPEQARLELLEYLPEEVELNLRKSLQDLFETIPPPDENSVAFADSRINISLNKYLLEKNDLLKTELNQYARAGADIDVTMLKYLEGEKSPKDFEVDPNLRIYAEGKKPKVGLDRWTRVLSFLVLFLTIGIIFYSPSFESCKGEIIQFNDLELCLTSPDDHLTYRAAQIRDYINHNNYKPIDSLEKKAIKQYFLFNSGKRTVAEVGKVQQAEYSVGSIIPFFKNDTSILHFYQNLAVDFYNHGVPSYNRFDSLGKSVDEYYQISGDSIKFCAAFEEAKFYDNKIERRGVSAEVENILKMQCSIQNNAQNLPLENNKKVKPNTIGGKVYDKENPNVRLSGVEVDIADLSNNIITNQRGRYELQLPENFTQDPFLIKFSKDGYREETLEVRRRELLVSNNKIDVPFDLPNVFLKKEYSSCYRTFMAEYKKVFDSGDNFESARKFLEAARICDDVGVKEKREIDKEIKRVDKLLEDLLRSRNEQQNGEQTQPIPADDKVTLEIEIRNKKTNNLQPGFELKIKGISSSEITTLRSGAQFKVDVEKGSTHRMTAVLNDLVLGEKLIIATPQSGESTVKVTLEVGLPVAANSDIAWKDATRRNTLKAYSAYLERYPDGQYSKEAKKRIIELTPKEKSKTGNFEFRMDDNDQKGKFLIVNPIGEIKMERAGYPGSVFVLKYFEKAQGYLIQRANSYQHLKALPSNGLIFSEGTNESGMIWNLIPVENGTKYLLQNSSGLYLTSLPGDRGLIMGNDPVLESTWWTLKKVNYRESGK